MESGLLYDDRELKGSRLRLAQPETSQPFYEPSMQVKVVLEARCVFIYLGSTPEVSTARTREQLENTARNATCRR